MSWSQYCAYRILRREIVPTAIAAIMRERALHEQVMSATQALPYALARHNIAVALEM